MRLDRTASMTSRKKQRRTVDAAASGRRIALSSRHRVGPLSVVAFFLGFMFLSCRAGTADESEVYVEPPITEFDRDHWSYRPIVEPGIPVVDSEWPRNEIDHFVVARLTDENLAPQPDASNRTLIRRLTYDLTGLPPTLGEIAAFETDDSPTVYSQLVDRLLASPRYGERWAQHWLDLARFAETDGFEHD